MFSPRRAYRDCLRLNFGHPWSAAHEQAIERLGRMLAEQR